MKYILATVFVIVMILFAIITSVLATHKEEIWECIKFKKKQISRDVAVVAYKCRQLVVVGSNPTPATILKERGKK